MLCRVYNELLNNEKQVARAKILWDREPGHPEATQWMANSLLNSLGRSKTESKDFIEFVDDALSKKLGNHRRRPTRKAGR